MVGCGATRHSATPSAPAAAAVGDARRFVHEATCAVHGADLVDASVLCASELVANALRHGSPPVTLALRCDELTGVELRVTDGDPRPPVLRDVDLDALGGRGMLLVDGLSDAWGVAPTEGGKAVWCRLRPAV